MVDNRIISQNPLEDDANDNAIRPVRLDDFNGQDDIKENLKIAIAAAKQRGEPLDHILFSGQPGLGKTTLANIIAREMGVGFHSTIGTLLEKPKDIIGLFTSIEEGDVIFVDEIHRTNPVVEETLYPAMEDFTLDTINGEGKNARPFKVNLEPFTLIGATTKPGNLCAPFRDRFGHNMRFNLYTQNELVTIAKRSAKIMDINATQSGIDEIAKRSRGTPRIVNRLLRRVRDYAVVKGNGTITPEVAASALNLLKIDPMGLDELDKRILSLMAKDFEGKPVGLKTISISVGEDIRTIEDMYEPYLIQIGFLKRTSQGREITKAAKQYICS